MNIVFFTENTHCGGMDSFLVTLINHWPHPEDKLVLICNASHPGIEVLRTRLTRPCTVRAHGIPTYLDLIKKFKHWGIPRLMTKLISPLLRYGLYVYDIIKLRTELFQGGPDRLMVVNGGHPGGDTCRAAVITWGMFATGRPHAIYNFHNLAAPSRWFEKLPDQAVDFFVTKYSRAMVGVSRACAESLGGRMGESGMRKTSWIYNGIAAPSPAPRAAALREELGLSSESPICLMLASYEPRKGHDFLLRAFQRVIFEIPAARLLICGYGYPDEIAKVKALVSRYSLSNRVFLQGFRQDTDSLLAQSDVLLVASQAFESFGLTSVEAMANRVPVVATNIGGIPEVVANGEGGYCVDPDDVEGFAARIIEFLSDPPFRAEQAEKGYLRYRRLFTAERMAAEYARLIRADAGSTQASLFVEQRSRV